MNIVLYRRVSTGKQGRSGLGLDAQDAALEAFTKDRKAKVLGTFVEVESGKTSERSELKSALHLCRVTGATLVIAKLDRLSRNAAFLLTLRDSGEPPQWRARCKGHAKATPPAWQSFVRTQIRMPHNWRPL